MTPIAMAGVQRSVSWMRQKLVPGDVQRGEHRWLRGREVRDPAMRVRINRASDVCGEPQRTRDQLAQIALVPALGEHAIERERRLSQPMHAPRHALLGSLNAAYVFLRKGFHHRQLRPREVGDAVLYSSKRADLSALPTDAA